MKGTKMLSWIRKLFGNKFKTGTEIVDDVVSQFTDTVDTLHSAIEDIDGDITYNQSKITVLKAKNTYLGATKVTGLKLIRGIKTLLGD